MSIKKIRDIVWGGPTPTNCDRCGDKLHARFYDGPIGGRWGSFCCQCWNHRPVGTGYGQQYTKMSDGKYHKTAG